MFVINVFDSMFAESERTSNEPIVIIIITISAIAITIMIDISAITYYYYYHDWYQRDERVDEDQHGRQEVEGGAHEPIIIRSTE